MYAKIASTTWDHARPARSQVSAGWGQDAFEFEHELGCPMQGSPGPCTCYVSRIRLIKTPVGRTIPTTEPNLRPELEYQQKLTARLSRSLWIVSAVCILTNVGQIILIVVR